MSGKSVSPLRVAVIGLGWWGKTIVPLLQASSKLEVVAAVDPDPAAAAFATQSKVRLLGSLDEALQEKDIEGVVLCTPHTTHTGQIAKAAGAKKHVFCEKPLGMTRKQVLESVASCNQNRVVLAVGHEKRFEPPIQEVMRLVKSGQLGTPLQAECNFSQDKFLSLAADNWRLSGKEAPAGPMTATGIHLLDLSVGVFGEAQTVFASVKQLGSQLTNGDTLGILVTFRNGGHSLISAVLATPFDGRFAVYGSKGWAEVRDKAHPEDPQGWVLTTSIRNTPRRVVEYPPAKAVLSNLEAFAEAARGGAPYPVPQSEMIANISALEAVFRSARSGKVEDVDNGIIGRCGP